MTRLKPAEYILATFLAGFTVYLAFYIGDALMVLSRAVSP